MNIAETIAHSLNVRSTQVAAVISLLDDGNTVPFIARYRKEATGALDDAQVRIVQDEAARMRKLEDRREAIRASVSEQGMMTPELDAAFVAAATMTELEDLYAPYRPKRRTRASIARDKGLEPLAKLILAQEEDVRSLEAIVMPFVTEEVGTLETALAGARDIVAEVISDDAQVRQSLRQRAAQSAMLQTAVKEAEADTRQVYSLYYEFATPIGRLRPHQTLAINRGESEGILRVALEIPEADWLLAIRTAYRPSRHSPLYEQLELAIEDAAKRLLLPAIGRDLRRELTEQADAHAIDVFATNLRALLSQPPLREHVILGIDPGFRTGCKIAVIDQTGKVLQTGTIYPHPPQKQADQATTDINELIQTYGVTLIAIGNGTASRETEQLVANITRKSRQVHYVIVNEAGASVYSASDLARAELPDLDVSIRGAVSIARRVQDPLAELVKIDPQSIGVGLYQHDVDQKKLAAALEGVVESVVNQVGVDLNSASAALLTYVSGVGPSLAERIVAHRDAHGPFTNRQALRQVSGLGPKAFEQAAGFLRIHGGENPLDATAIHPESYDVALKVMDAAGLASDSSLEQRMRMIETLKQSITAEQLAEQSGTDVHTLRDLVEQIIRPGRDPRDELPAPLLRSDVLTMDDLSEGMVLKGTIRNVVDFGAFVDIGVKQDGLLHSSQIPRSQRLSVGDVIDVTILNVDSERGRIGLGWSGS